MRLVEPAVQLLNPANGSDGIQMLHFIEAMARISHRSEDRQSADTWKRFLKAVVMEHGDWSVVEHSSATAIFRVNRGVTHELVRHRLFSFTQESTRFVNGRKSYPNGLEFIGSTDYAKSFLAAEEVYLEALDRGVRPQEARAVLPNALAATISVTGNLRNWRHLLLMRTSKETHPEFKEVMIPLLKMFQERIPLLFDDIIPDQKQSANMRMPR